MKNNIEVCILFNDKSNILIYCHNIEFHANGFTIQFLDNDNNFDEMFISKDNLQSFEVYSL